MEDLPSQSAKFYLQNDLNPCCIDLLRQDKSFEGLDWNHASNESAPQGKEKKQKGIPKVYLLFLYFLLEFFSAEGVYDTSQKWSWALITYYCNDGQQTKFTHPIRSTKIDIPLNKETKPNHSVQRSAILLWPTPADGSESSLTRLHNRHCLVQQLNCQSPDCFPGYMEPFTPRGKNKPLA